MKNGMQRTENLAKFNKIISENIKQ